MIAAVPPTTHSLPKPQRVRLMRSTRKLSALLGTTPLLVEPMPMLTPARAPSPVPEPESPLEPSPERPATITSTAPPRRSSLAATPASTQRPTLLLRINTAPPRPRGRVRSQAWGRPTSCPAVPQSPSSESEPMADGVPPLDAALTARRKKMARLARTLGESVPVELVFPAGAPILPPIASPDAAGDETLDDSASTASSERLSSASERKSYRSTASEGLPSASAECPWFPYAIRRASSQAYRPLDQKRLGTDASGRRHRDGHRNVLKRSEAGWSGEWNQDEKFVLKSLRELK
ncbi:hypothetical protein FB451DRAFT_1416881 [Mycena latifolia]|nr:hypothetical protein FB451DRAFT_1416881 [Mycena latifolia]